MPRRNEPTSRMCAVTREVKPVAELLRFVADPSGEVTLDLKRRLPGRGIWISARADLVRKAVDKKLFARSLTVPLRVDSDLPERTADQLKRSVAAALSLARKAGVLVTGFDSVDAAIRSGRVAALIHAAEASDDGVGKLRAAMRRRHGDDHNKPTLRRLTEPELSLALGRPHVIHAALLAGRASRHALDQINQLARFHNDGPSADMQPLMTTADLTAEPKSL